MSVSSTFGSKVAVLPSFSCSIALGLGRGGTFKTAPRVGGGPVIECSSRPKKKATAHHMKTRPRKTQPWDVRRKPTVYPPLPPLPPDWTLVADDAVPPPPAPPQPLKTE